jgi:hypothetical protein
MRTTNNGTIAALLLLGLLGSANAAAPETPALAGSGQAGELPAVLAPFVEHLRFLGYQVTPEGALLKAVHDRSLNFTLREVSGGAMLLCYFEGKQSQIDLPRLEFVERLNQAATSARYYWDDESDLMVEAWFPGVYDRERFAVFMEAWRADGDRVFAAEGLTDLVE